MEQSVTSAGDFALLLERCRRGDALAWEALVRQYQGKIYGIACRLTGGREDAKDLTQDVFVRIYNHLDEFSDPNGFVPWMVRITKNACIDHLRRRKARPQTRDVPQGYMAGLPSGERTQEEILRAGASRALIRRALSQLSQLSREVLFLREIQGLALAEIAAQLRVPLGTVKSRSNRARTELAEKVLKLEPRGASPV